MPDYINEIRNGTMMIRDTGAEVQFWFKTGSSTWNNEQNWGFAADSIGYQEFEYRLLRGGNWQMFGAVHIGTRQNVMFRIVGEGLGWPTTDFTVFIERARQPDPPQQPFMVDRNDNAIRVAFNYNYDGGMGIVEARIWYSFDGQPRYLAPGRDYWIGGLAPKTFYNFWGEVRNDRGWSGLGPANTFRTLGTPDQPPPPNVTPTNPISASGAFSGYPWDGGSPVLEWQIGYGMDPNGPTNFVSGDIFNLTNLSIARQYYFWARGRNAYGWGPWSARRDVLLPAGAWVKVDGVWRRAVPWVKQSGTWKMARPLIPVNGVWRSASS